MINKKSEFCRSYSENFFLYTSLCLLVSVCGRVSERKGRFFFFNVGPYFSEKMTQYTSGFEIETSKTLRRTGHDRRKPSKIPSEPPRPANPSCYYHRLHTYVPAPRPPPLTLGSPRNFTRPPTSARCPFPARVKFGLKLIFNRSIMAPAGGTTNFGRVAFNGRRG